MNNETYKTKVKQNFTQINKEFNPYKILCIKHNGVIQLERWRKVPGYEGIYDISSFGRAYSLIRKKIIKLSLEKNGYFRIGLSKKNNKRTTKRIHQLVAMAFLNHKPNGLKLVVDHINEVKTDNYLWNLQLISSRENTNKSSKSNILSKYTGITFRKDVNKWRAYINIDGVQKHLGYYDSEEDASDAHEMALDGY